MAVAGSADEWERLRAAAVGVLAAAGDAAGQLPAALGTALDGLRDALRGEAPGSAAGRQLPVQDPFGDFLTSRRYSGSEPGQPIPLETMAADLKRRLGNDRGIDDRQPGERAWNVTITELRGMVIASLLEELAARLSPGAAFGPGKHGIALARVALDLSKELQDQTFVGSS